MEAPDLVHGGFFRAGNTHFSPENRHSEQISAEQFLIEDLLDFSNEDAHALEDEAFDCVAGNSTDSSAITAVDSCNSSFSGSEPHFPGDMSYQSFTDSQFTGELCVPYDDAAELEWLSNFVEKSFSSDDLQKLQFLSGLKVPPEDEISEARESSDKSSSRNEAILRSDASVPGKARSKRSRGVPCNWSSRILAQSPTAATSSSESATSGEISAKKSTKSTPNKEPSDAGGDSVRHGRKCLHCATEKTPQWRAGPMGPKTLCNACGVRYKSGRLVPEYRPAASPTFVLARHSNSHRKVMELRRQQELQRSQQQMQIQLPQPQLLHPASFVDIADEYLIQQHGGSDFSHLT